ncbi:MAG: ATP-binding protein [Bacteroidales bacterium]|nr:ATP-binding protein [Bacteroidales bacterium]
MEIRRDIIDQFKAWKDSPSHKPILLKGARQIGKTWAMEAFGKECFEYCVKFDFDRSPELKSVFQATKSPERIISELALYCSAPIIAGKTLIIFDEIQECEEALNSLKYFCEEAPDYHIVAAGSLLGVAVRQKQMSVPVGKVKVMRMYPITFREFLRAIDANTYQYVDSITEIAHLPEIILNKLKTAYRQYQICGGMPEATVALIEGKGIAEVEDIQQGILDLYELDFSRYASAREIPRIQALWHSLPAQLSKENRKFIYRVVRQGARSKDYEDALLWLVDAGMIHMIYNVSKPGIPLAAYEETNAFKVYACDCGLLRRLARLPASVIIDPVANYTEFKGAVAENAVLQSLMALSGVEKPCYWTSDSTAEVEFVIQIHDKVIPIEVKAEDNVKGRSITVYNEKYHPELRLRYSMLNLQYNCSMLSCPSPLVGWLHQLMHLIQKN